MTGISWGGYQDYLNGSWDGEIHRAERSGAVGHWDDAQTQQDGTPIQHGVDIPYMVPTIGFTDYLVEKLRPIIALGVEGVHLEEPEFWARAGYSASFTREWQAFYGEPWHAPHSSPEAHFRSGRLKQHLLTRSLDRVTSVLHDEALRQGRDVRFYVPTHSLLNYTQWQIVSPESQLRQLVSVHGAIAQVWTGTARTPNVYSGERAERTFETAYLEYGIAQDLTRGTDNRMWFLHDPIEDHPDRTWEDYLANYRRTLVASLLHPGVAHYEVAPWPDRIFNRPHLSEGSDERVHIPADNATSYLIAMNSLRDLDQPDVRWEYEGPRIGVFLSDTAMFQRWRPGSESRHYDGLQDDASDDLLTFSDFYGLALPPLFDGQRVCPVQLENLVNTPDAVDDVEVLILSYEFQKPLSPAIHYALAGWVARGGALLYVGDGSDPYHQIREWWSGRYPTAAHHLAEALGAGIDATGLQRVGAGLVRFVPEAPAVFTESAGRAAELVGYVEELATTSGKAWLSGNWLSVRRGPYLVGAVLSEAASSTSIDGRYLDLLDPTLPVVRTRDLRAGDVVWMRDLTYDDEILLASAGRVRDLSTGTTQISYRCEAPRNVDVVTALRVPSAPHEVTGGKWDHDADAGIVWVRHPGLPQGTKVTVSW